MFVIFVYNGSLKVYFTIVTALLFYQTHKTTVALSMIFIAAVLVILMIHWPVRSTNLNSTVMLLYFAHTPYLARHHFIHSYWHILNYVIACYVTTTKAELFKKLANFFCKSCSKWQLTKLGTHAKYGYFTVVWKLNNILWTALLIENTYKFSDWLLCIPPQIGLSHKL